MLELTKESFDKEVLAVEGPVAVDFWAPWCGPCRALAPKLEALAVKFEGKVKVAKMDIEEYPNTAEDYNIRAIPTILFFENGKVTHTIVGADASKIEATMEKVSKKE